MGSVSFERINRILRERVRASAGHHVVLESVFYLEYPLRPGCGAACLLFDAPVFDLEGFVLHPWQREMRADLRIISDSDSLCRELHVIPLEGSLLILILPAVIVNFDRLLGQ